ncbi:hypothetical protein ACHAQA_003254 [Verticillium albo-atrum]
MASSHTASDAEVKALQQYSACDVSDALVKLKVPGGGFIPDLHLYSQPDAAQTSITIAPASTVLFVPKGTTLESPPANIPRDAHWVDLTPPGTVVVIRQPDGQKNAIWARGLSTVGAGAASSPWAVQVPLDIDGTVVHPGDLVFSDPINGVVVIPREKVGQVLELLPRLTAADDKVKEDVLKGVSVQDAFQAHRSNL